MLEPREAIITIIITGTYFVILCVAVIIRLRQIKTTLDKPVIRIQWIPLDRTAPNLGELTYYLVKTDDIERFIEHRGFYFGRTNEGIHKFCSFEYGLEYATDWIPFEEYQTYRQQIERTKK